MTRFCGENERTHRHFLYRLLFRLRFLHEHIPVLRPSLSLPSPKPRYSRSVCSLRVLRIHMCGFRSDVRILSTATRTLVLLLRRVELPIPQERTLEEVTGLSVRLRETFHRNITWKSSMSRATSLVRIRARGSLESTSRFCTLIRSCCHI